MATDARSTLTPSIDPEDFEKRAHVSAEAQKRIHDILDELGPELFTGQPQKNTAQESNSRDH